MSRGTGLLVLENYIVKYYSYGSTAQLNLKIKKKYPIEHQPSSNYLSSLTHPAIVSSFCKILPRGI